MMSRLGLRSSLRRCCIQRIACSLTQGDFEKEFVGVEPSQDKLDASLVIQDKKDGNGVVRGVIGQWA